MNCPHDSNQLVIETLRGIEIDRCPTCRGMWLDHDELDKLEDTVLDDDTVKGTTIFTTFPSELVCPVCTKRMDSFNYRLYDLELQVCPDKHGFWLDADEDEKIRHYMQQRVSGLERNQKAQSDWWSVLRRLGIHH